MGGILVAGRSLVSEREDQRLQQLTIFPEEKFGQGCKASFHPVLPSRAYILRKYTFK